MTFWQFIFNNWALFAAQAGCMFMHKIDPSLRLFWFILVFIISLIIWFLMLDANGIL